MALFLYANYFVVKLINVLSSNMTFIIVVIRDNRSILNDVVKTISRSLRPSSGLVGKKLHTDYCRPGTSHKSCSFGDALTILTN